MMKEQHSQQPDRLLSKKQVLGLVPYSAVHLYRLMAKGQFPKQCSCSANRVAWSQAEILAWIEAKKNSRPATKTSKEIV